jgi:hypothetical protein
MWSQTENVVNDPQQFRRASVNRFNILFLRWCKLCIEKKNTAGDNGIKRSPDFMAHICQNFGEKGKCRVYKCFSSALLLQQPVSPLPYCGTLGLSRLPRQPERKVISALLGVWPEMLVQLGHFLGKELLSIKIMKQRTPKVGDRHTQYRHGIFGAEVRVFAVYGIEPRVASCGVPVPYYRLSKPHYRPEISSHQ